MILIYAFSDRWGTNVSHRVLLELQKHLPPLPLLHYHLIRFHPREFFNRYIKNSQYHLIIGLGDYYGRSPRIRIETRAHNRFGQGSVDSLAPVSLELSLPVLDFVEKGDFSITEHMGSFNCNWLAFQTQLYILRYRPHCRQLFFHLPRKINPISAAHRLVNLFENNQVLK